MAMLDLSHQYLMGKINTSKAIKIKIKYVSDTFGKKAKCYAIFIFLFFLENELSPMRFFKKNLQPRLNVYVLCDIQKQKH